MRTALIGPDICELPVSSGSTCSRANSFPPASQEALPLSGTAALALVFFVDWGVVLDFLNGSGIALLPAGIILASHPPHLTDGETEVHSDYRSVLFPPELSLSEPAV